MAPGESKPEPVKENRGCLSAAGRSAFRHESEGGVRLFTETVETD